jgi:hypothetical protein
MKMSAIIAAGFLIAGVMKTDAAVGIGIGFNDGQTTDPKAAMADAARLKVAEPGGSEAAGGVRNDVSAGANSELIDAVNDPAICGRSSSRRERQCRIGFADWYAWVYYQNDGKTFKSAELLHEIGALDHPNGHRPEYRWVGIDAAGNVTTSARDSAVARDSAAVCQSDASCDFTKRRPPVPLSPDEARQELSSALTAFRAGVHDHVEHACSGPGEYMGHHMGCCEGLSPVQVSNDADICLDRSKK